MAVQNNFNAKNGGNFADRQINNTPPSPTKDKMLTSSINQGGKASTPLGNSTFNSMTPNS